jgi:hypothetical protein
MPFASKNLAQQKNSRHSKRATNKKDVLGGNNYRAD